MLPFTASADLEYGPILILFYISPWVGCISGGHDGAYSVALSGGYEDDVDLGYAL